MLTGDLLRFTRRKGVLAPRLLDPGDARWLETAGGLLELVGHAGGTRRGELEETLAMAQPPELDAKVCQGLTKLLLDRCEFATTETAEPRALRRVLFDGAAEAWRTQPRSQLDQWRARVVADAGEPLGLTPEEVEAALYGDLPDNQRLLSFRPLEAESLLCRYNVAQVQGLLLRAEWLELSTPPAPPSRLRQWLRYLQFFGLLFQLERQESGAVLLRLDGPLSLLESGNRYGMNLAQFFPVLLHWEGAWRMEAGLSPRPGRPTGVLRLEPHPWLRSHYPDQGQWLPEALRKFQERFNSQQPDWRADSAEELLPLPGNRSLVPDLVLRPTAGGRPVYLELLPQPLAERVTGRLELIDQRGERDYLLACRRTPAVQAMEQHPALLTFRRTLLVDPVMRRLAETPKG